MKAFNRERVAVEKYLTRLTHLLPLLLFGVALGIVHHEVKVYQIGDIASVIEAVPYTIVAVAIGLTLVNYLVLAGYDILALRYTGNRIPLPQLTLASLIGYAISNNTGHAWASGGSVRYRFYTAWGVPGWDVMKISLFLGMTYLLGVLTLGLAGTMLLPGDLRAHVQNPQLILWLGVASALALGLYWLMILFWRKPITIRDVELRLPSPAMTLGQTIISSIDVVLSSLVLWAFLAGHVDISFKIFLVTFVVAQIAGVLSQVPGGIGVFESALLWLLGGVLAGEQHLALVVALLLYRVVYYFIPLLLAGAGLLIYEAYERRTMLIKGGAALQQALSSFVPQVFSVLLLFTGATLLVSGATPVTPQHMRWLRELIPLPLVEISHLLGSLAGLLLLFLARGIRLRIDAAWYGSLFFLALGIVVSLLKGVDWHEAAILGVLLLLMVPAKGYFYRRSSLFAMSFNASWLLMICIVLAGSTWLGFFAFRHVDYSDDLWWQFSYQDEAPRFLRTLLLMAVTVTGYPIYRLLAVAHPRSLKLPSREELEEAEQAFLRGDDTKGFLALLGDKSLFWSDDRTAFIMFAATPKYWIAMGDPIGNKASFENALWGFREKADRYGAKAVFYEVRDTYLPLYLDLGLVLLKMGEEARLSLADFSLEGKKRADLRGGRNKFTRLDYSFAVLEREEVRANMKRLREISDLWLAKKHAEEKRFSLGFFDEFYLSHTRVAVARDPGGQIMAFANIWETHNREEVSIDLMRYDPESPGGIMDYLFAELMLWAQGLGFRWFSLGMAPLSGMERHPLAPLWHKIGVAVFDMGEEFYNFEGLYEYKAKFGPEWLPRYLAVPAGLSVPLIVMNIARLIAGGWRGIFSR